MQLKLSMLLTRGSTALVGGSIMLGTYLSDPKSLCVNRFSNILNTWHGKVTLPARKVYVTYQRLYCSGGRQHHAGDVPVWLQESLCLFWIIGLPCWHPYVTVELLEFLHVWKGRQGSFRFMLAMCYNPYLLSSVPCIFLCIWLALLASLQLFLLLLCGVLTPAFFVGFPACVGSLHCSFHTILSMLSVWQSQCL